MILVSSRYFVSEELRYAVGEPIVWSLHERARPPINEFQFALFTDSYEDDSLQMQVFPNVGEYAGKSLCSSPTKTT